MDKSFYKLGFLWLVILCALNAGASEYSRTNNQIGPSIQAGPITSAVSDSITLRVWSFSGSTPYTFAATTNPLALLDVPTGIERFRVNPTGTDSNSILWNISLPRTGLGVGTYRLYGRSYSTGNSNLVGTLEDVQLVITADPTASCPDVTVNYTSVVNLITATYTQAVTNVISSTFGCNPATISQSQTGGVVYWDFCSATAFTNVQSAYTTGCSSNTVSMTYTGGTLFLSACLTNIGSGGGGGSQSPLTNDVNAAGYTISNAIELSVYRRFNHGQSNTLGTNVEQAFLATTGGVISNSAKRAAIIASVGNTIDNQDTAAIIASRNSLMTGGSQYGGSIVSCDSVLSAGSVSLMAACRDSNLGWWVNPAYAFQIGGFSVYYNDAWRGGILGGWFGHVQDGPGHGAIYDTLVLGGYYNTVTNGGHRSIAAGGQYNIAALEDSFAAGWAASATSRNSFVWNARSGTRTATTGSNQFLIASFGGVGLPIIATNATALANPPEGIVLHYFFTNATTTNEEWRFPDGNVKVRSM